MKCEKYEISTMTQSRPFRWNLEGSFQSYHLEELGFFDWTSISPLFLQTIDIYCFISGASFLSVVHRKKEEYYAKEKNKEREEAENLLSLVSWAICGLRMGGNKWVVVRRGVRFSIVVWEEDTFGETNLFTSIYFPLLLPFLLFRLSNVTSSTFSSCP